LHWRIEVGAAWSGFAVSGSRAFTQEQRGPEECVTCYDRSTGRPLWVHSDPAHYENASTGDGPRATPTIDRGQVFTLGATGILNALDAATGERQWSVDIVKDAGAIAPAHGMVSSPLVVDDLVVVSAGGENASLVAYDRHSGTRVWGAGSDPAGYTSPLLVKLDGQRQIVVVTTEHIHGHDALTGQVLWTVPFGNEQQTNCSQPVPIGVDRLFASTNYGTGCTLLELTREGSAWQAKPLWSKRTLQTKFCSPVVHEGYAYGLDDGILECVSLEDGRRQWKRGRFGHGQLMLVDDLLLIQAEDGHVALVAAQPQELTELSSIPALEGRTWNYPALAGSELFIRNDRQAACYELPLQGH
jgi:outer membrane protein assembly factor BamB